MNTPAEKAEMVVTNQIEICERKLSRESCIELMELLLEFIAERKEELEKRTD